MSLFFKDTSTILVVLVMMEASCWVHQDRWLDAENPWLNAI